MDIELDRVQLLGTTHQAKQQAAKNASFWNVTKSYSLILLALVVSVVTIRHAIYLLTDPQKYVNYSKINDQVLVGVNLGLAIPKYRKHEKEESTYGTKHVVTLPTTVDTRFTQLVRVDVQRAGKPSFGEEKIELSQSEINLSEELEARTVASQKANDEKSLNLDDNKSGISDLEKDLRLSEPNKQSESTQSTQVDATNTEIAPQVKITSPDEESDEEDYEYQGPRKPITEQMKEIVALLKIKQNMTIPATSTSEESEDNIYHDDNELEQTPFEVILSTIDAIKYRDHAKFFGNPAFQTIYKHLDDAERTTVDTKLFTYSWNEPQQVASGLYEARRFPDVIGIGVRKCGTSAFERFMGLHPSMKVNWDETEVHFFSLNKNFRKGPEWYLDQLLPATSDEIVYEKTPKYLLAENVPARILQTMPNAKEMKFVVMVCNPVDRAYSDFNHVLADQNKGSNKPKRKRKKDRLTYKDFNELVPYIIDIVKKAQSMGKAAFAKWVKHLYYTKSREYMILTNGFYDINLREFIDAGFTRDQFYIINGERLYTEPGKIFKEFETFMGLPEYFGGANSAGEFKINPATGYYCFYRTGNSEPYCLPKSKGRTRGGSTGKVQGMTAETRQLLVDFYRPFTEEFYKNFDIKFRFKQ